MASKRGRRPKRRPWSNADVRELRAHSRSKSPLKKSPKTAADILAHGDPCRPQAQGDPCDRRSIRPLHPAGRPRSHPVQRTGVRRQGRGSQLSAPRPLTSSGAVPGRTATSRASTRAFATSCSTAKSSTRSERPESSSRAGGATTHQAARLIWIQATSTGGVRACLRRVAGCATTSGSAGHAGATANLKLTFHLDHSTGADHCTPGAKAELPRAAGAARAFH
jgi:hypothetical protein